VNHYLPYVKQWLITHLMLALLPLKTLFTESSQGVQLFVAPQFSSTSAVGHLLFQAFFTERSLCVQLLAPHTFSSVPSVPYPVCCMSFQFLVFYPGVCVCVCVFVCVCVEGVGLPRGLCWFIPGVAVGISHAAYLLTC
jgi:hypothetical protein